MAALETHRQAGAVAVPGGRVARAVSALVARVVAWNDARATRNALSKLSDRQLDDIGLTRGDLDTFMKGLR